LADRNGSRDDVSLVQPVSLAQWVADLIAERIIQGRYPEGHWLREQELAAEFRLSRSPIREALRILERDGHIELQPRRGAIVTTLNPKIVDEIYKCRMRLTALVAEEAAPHLTEEDFECLDRVVKRMEQAVAVGDTDAYFHCNVEFHNLLWERSDNSVLQQILRALNSRVLRLRYLSMSLPTRAAISLAAHQDMLRELRTGNGEAAGRVSANVVDGARQAILKHLQTRPNPTDDGRTQQDPETVPTPYGANGINYPRVDRLAATGGQWRRRRNHD
jgi:DNA-binding GntR family transcriptional regulator